MKKLFYPIFSTLEQALQIFTTKLAGALAKSEQKRLKNYLINYFIQKFDVNMAESETTNAFDYKSFNAFFTRALKKDARTIDPESFSIASPVDGTISEFGSIAIDKLIQAKNIEYSLSALLNDETQAKTYKNGNFITIYLAPTDYHRIHMPVTAKLESMSYIPGRLYPVKPAVVETVKNVFALNERLICNFASQFGTFSLVLVGAQLVSGLETVWHGPINESKPKTWHYKSKQIVLNKGQEMGRFNFGSTIILCLKNNIKFKANIKKNKTILLGTALAQYTSEV
ncbi:MAG: phosphatidylserine decarboxylase [Legionellales bacterium]|jgi:phosphatidylserine decarboxylase|nr:phosphatidylserine decarboxylase [Legionellales bacterium]